MKGCDGGSAEGAVYSAFCSSTSVKRAVGFGQLWQSLPIAPKLLVAIVLAELCIWIADAASITKPLLDCNGKGSWCIMEHRQITATTLVAQLLYAYLLLDAIHEENAVQLLASLVLGITSCLLWLVLVVALGLPSPAWRIGLAMGFTASTAAVAWLAYLTHQQFGWRVHSKLACDLRRKHAAEKQHLYFALNRFRTLLKLTTVTALLNAASSLAVALGFMSMAAMAAADSTSHPAVSGMLASAGLYGLPLLWLVVTYLAVRFNSNKLELLSTATVLVLLLLPAFPLYWSLSSAYSWPGRVTVRAALLAMPLGTWLILHCTTWWTMRHVLQLLRTPHIKDLVAAIADDLSDQQQDVPEQLQPLLKGAWLLKAQCRPAARASAARASSVVPSCSKLSRIGSERHPRVSSSSWAIPVFSSFRQAPSSNAGGSWHQWHADNASSIWQQAAALFGCSSNRWRFFQLSTDLTTLRWSWNKYVLLYYVDTFEVDADRLTITLHMALDPDLTLAFVDPRSFDQWESALQLLLLMLTGTAPGTVRTDAHAVEEPACAAEASAGCSKARLPHLMAVESCSSGSIPAAGLGGTYLPSGVVGAAGNSPQLISQHSLVAAALIAQQQLKARRVSRKHGNHDDGSVGGLDDTSLPVAAKLRRSMSSFFKASRRRSVNDPHALQLQQAQALVEVVTRQLSSHLPTQVAPAAGSSSWPPAGLLQQQQAAEQQQHDEWLRLQQEQRWWLQQDLESLTADMPAADEGRPAAAAACAARPAAAVGQIGAAAGALGRQLDLPPHQVLSHLQQQPCDTEQQPAGPIQGLYQHNGAAESMQSCQSAVPGQQRNSPTSCALGTGFGPFRTPQGLLKQMQLAGQVSQQQQRLRDTISSSDDSSAAMLGPGACISTVGSNSDSAFTGTSHASSAPHQQQLQDQGGVGINGESPGWPYKQAAGASRASIPSRLQQQLPRGADWQLTLPAGRNQTPHHQQQQQQPLAHGMHVQHAGLLQSHWAERSGYIDPGSSSEASLRSKSALLLRTNFTPETVPSAASWGDSRQEIRALSDSWSWQQQLACHQPVRQFYEQQYSQPPSPNIYGVYTSAAVVRRDESPVVAPASCDDSGMLRAASMPAALHSWYGGSSIDTAQAQVSQYACIGSGHVHHHDAGPAAMTASPELAANAAKSGQYMHLGLSGGPLHPPEHSKPATAMAFKPPTLEDVVGSPGAIPAVWDMDNGPAEAAAIRLSQQNSWSAVGMPTAGSSDRATAGGSVMYLESLGGRSQASPEVPEPVRLPLMGSSNSNVVLLHQQFIHSTSTDACAAQQEYCLQQGASCSPPEQDAALVTVNSVHGTLGSSSTSRAASLLQAGLPPFSPFSAQVDGHAWQDTAAHPAASCRLELTSQQAHLQPAGGYTGTEPTAAVTSADAVLPYAPAAAAAVVNLTSGVQPSKSPAADTQHRQQGSSNGGSTWRASIHNFVTSIAHAVSGAGAASPRSSNPHGPNAQVGAGADSPVNSQPPPISGGRHQLSPFHMAASTAAAAAAAAAGGPGLRSPSRPASAASISRDKVAADTSRSFTSAGRTSFGRKASSAEASFRASNTDSVLASPSGPSRMSAGNLTVGGWSDWGRSTLTDCQSTTDSVIDMSGDNGLVDVRLAGAAAAVARAEADTGAISLVRSLGGFDMLGSSREQNSSEASDNATDIAASPTVFQLHEGHEQQFVQDQCATQGTQQQGQVTAALPASAGRSKSSGVAVTSASSMFGRSHSMGHLGIGRPPSVQYGSMPLLPVLPEAPAAAELDSTDASDSPDEQHQQPDGYSSNSSSSEEGPTVQPHSGQQQGPEVQGTQQRSSDEQDSASLCSFTFAASGQQEQPAQEQPQPITLQAAYQLAKSTAAGAVAADVSPPATWQVQTAGPPGAQCPIPATVIESGYGSNSGSPRIGVARPATLRVTVSDAAAAVRVQDAGASSPSAAAAGITTAFAHSPRMMSYSSMDSPKGAARLHVHVPDTRRPSGQGHGGFSHHHSPFAHHSTHHAGIGAHHHQQLAHHDDGYVVHSPGSLVSFNSHMSAYTDGSPRTGRTLRQSLGSAGFGGSLQLTNSLCMAYSGWSTHSRGSSRSAGSFRKGLAPQVPVDLTDWHSLHVGRTIGRGAEGCVFEARYQDAPIAVKEGPSMNEIEMYLAAGVHDNLVGLRGLCHKDDGTWCLLLEYCSRGSLDTLLHHSRSPLPRATHQHTSSSGRNSSSSGKATAAAGATAQAQQQPQQGRHDLPKLLPFMRGIARGLLHLHSRKPALLHRDIKPANIFIGHGMVMKIGDFGMSRLVHPLAAAAQDGNPAAAGSSRRGSPIATAGGSENGRANCARSSLAGARYSSGNGVPSATGAAWQHQVAIQSAGQLPNRTLTPGVVGTICYTAPEVLDEQLQAPNADVDSILKADVYSLGVTIWEMVERRRPFEGMDGMQICALWIADPGQMVLPPLTVGDNASDLDKHVLTALQELVTDCTAFNPEQRPTVNQVLARIKHIQRLYDPRAAAARASKGGDSHLAGRLFDALAPRQGSRGAAVGQGHDLEPAINIPDIKEDAGQQQTQLPPPGQGGQRSDATVADEHLHLQEQGTAHSGCLPAPGITDPAVAATIAAATHAAGTIPDACADSNKYPALVCSQQQLHGCSQVPGSRDAVRYRRSTSDSGAAYRSRCSSSVYSSNGLVHSSSLPIGQSVVLPEMRHLSSEAERRLSGAGLHYRHVR